MLDVEMIQAVAPAANIMDYQTTFGKEGENPWKFFNDTFRQIIKDNEKNPPDESVVSISYGLPETDFTEGDRATIDQSLQILNDAEHMTVFVLRSL
jgi:subtilase family serine protease